MEVCPGAVRFPRRLRSPPLGKQAQGSTTSLCSAPSVSVGEATASSGTEPSRLRRSSESAATLRRPSGGRLRSWLPHCHRPPDEETSAPDERDEAHTAGRSGCHTRGRPGCTSHTPHILRKPGIPNLHKRCSTTFRTCRTRSPRKLDISESLLVRNPRIVEFLVGLRLHRPQPGPLTRTHAQTAIGKQSSNR